MGDLFRAVKKWTRYLRATNFLLIAQPRSYSRVFQNWQMTLRGRAG